MRTTQTRLAAFLRLTEEPTDVKPNAKGYTSWQFSDTKLVLALVQKFSEGEARVEPKAYAASYGKCLQDIRQLRKEQD